MTPQALILIGLQIVGEPIKIAALGIHMRKLIIQFGKWNRAELVFGKPIKNYTQVFVKCSNLP